MGVVEDVRQVIQDFLAPELREIRALDEKLDFTAKGLNEKIDGTAKSLNEKIDGTARGLNEKIEALDRKLNSVAERMERQMEHNQRELLVNIQGLQNYALLSQRVAKLENQPQH